MRVCHAITAALGQSPRRTKTFLADNLKTAGLRPPRAPVRQMGATAEPDGPR